MPNTEQLVARQIAFYDELRRLEAHEQRPGRGRIGKVGFGPYLLISRQQGAGGHEVARRLGERLGWQVFDREIVDEIASQTQVRRQLIESLDERYRSVLEDLLLPMLDRHDISKAGYLHQLKQVVLTLGRQGNVILLGRGAHFILPRPFGLSVRLIAPLDIRVQRIAAEGDLTLAEAHARVHQSDHERATTIRRYFGHEAGDPQSHDLVLNTGHFTLEAVVEMVLAGLHLKLDVTPAHSQ